VTRSSKKNERDELKVSQHVGLLVPQPSDLAHQGLLVSSELDGEELTEHRGLSKPERKEVSVDRLLVLAEFSTHKKLDPLINSSHPIGLGFTDGTTEST